MSALPTSLAPEAWLAQPDAAARLAQVLEALGAAVAVKSLDGGTYRMVSPGFDKLFERSESTLLGATDAELMRPDEAQAMRRVELQVMQGGVLQTHDHRLDLGGHRREFQVVRIPLDAQHLLAAWTERTHERQREVQLQRALSQIEQHQGEMEALRRELQQGSGRDEITGLQQSGIFNEMLGREIDLSTREHREFSLVLIGLDLPAPVRESPAAADATRRLLEALGRLLRSNTRAMDAACRLDESHFAILLSGVGLATAHARMEQLRRQCAQQIVPFDGQDLGLSVSIGVASYPHTSANQAGLLESAQKALWHARRRGGNQVGLAAIALS